MMDCDGDGIPDNVCSDTKGSLWYTKSADGCKCDNCKSLDKEETQPNKGVVCNYKLLTLKQMSM